MKKLIAIIPALALSVAAVAQINDWDFECYDVTDTMNTPPANQSDDFLSGGTSNNLIGIVIGRAGSVAYGGQSGFCYGPQTRTLENTGGFALFTGGFGSEQDSFDDGMVWTFPGPRSTSNEHNFFFVLKGPQEGLQFANGATFGSGGFRSFIGFASGRKFQCAWNDADVDVTLDCGLLGDAIVLRWSFLNLQADNQELGLAVAGTVGMLSNEPDVTGRSAAFFAPPGSLASHVPKHAFPPLDYLGFAVVPGEKPVRLESKWDLNDPNFPEDVQFAFGQTDAYGFRLDNVPPPVTEDATSADLFLIGNHSDVATPGLVDADSVRYTVFGDPTGLLDKQDVLVTHYSYVQRFPTVAVAPGGSRQIVHYIRTTWSTGDYNRPYALILDTPDVINTEPSGQDGLSPNPFPVRAYVDNQYSTFDKTADLFDVRFEINLPPGLRLVPGETVTKIVPRINANQIVSIDWMVESDGTTFGDMDIEITVRPTPGPTKTLTTNIQVAAAPIMRLPEGAVLKTFPYEFSDSSLNAILGLQSGLDYLAFRWDSQTASYQPALSVERGRSYFIIPLSDLGFQQLNGASLPDDIEQGGLLVNLDPGWNLIGNPYQYAVTLGQLIGVVESAPDDTMTWDEMVQQGLLSSALVFFDRGPTGDDPVGTYEFTQGSETLVVPQRGYWVFNATLSQIRLIWPSVLTLWVRDDALKRSTSEPAFPQTARQWRLQLSARSGDGFDANNYVGVVADTASLNRLRLLEPPLAPNQKLALSIEDQMNGRPVRSAQALIDQMGAHEWNVSVFSDVAGDVTVTWPNLPSIPRNVRFRLEDIATGETRDLRAVSGYTFNMNQPGTREFKLSMSVGGSARPVIGSVVVSRPGRAPSSPFSIRYALSADALVTVRVLSSTGKEVYTISRGRAEGAGENEAIWYLKDNANRAVAPGVYNIEILAETPNGERVRRIVPVNVIR